MKRVTEKVKDIIEICPFTHLHDFAADPGLTLGGYHFTDITADLMSKWIERVANVRSGQGVACALAGFRGVGKSHFLSVLGAIVSRPELRSKITDAHVNATAERLSRRHGSVAMVRRGSGTSLLDELKRSIAVILETSPAELNDSLYDLLLTASERVGDMPLVILIDTALGRESRVSRDDGPMLSEIAEAAKAIGAFVAVALDDDISGADGPNSAISGSFYIDYLDQEHLYRIVDSVIFSKNNQMRGILHEIYEDYRSELPGFRWSEQRFTSLYPLHPATVEIAPLIRLFVHDFALLGFAAESGVKILGRPANSLIGLDEVFDSVESKLRAVPELAEVFEGFDLIERDVISKVPVLVRHPAKLILKGLTVLSLGGEGASADELAATMMISNPGNGAALDVEQLLESFAQALPKGLDRVEREGGKARYCLRIGSKVDLDAGLSEAAEAVADSVPMRILRAYAAEKWSDLDSSSPITHCSVEWRGAIRRGELIWPPAEDDEDRKRERRESPDWTVRVEPSGEGEQQPEEPNSFVWRLAPLSADEIQSLKRLHLLQTAPEIREQFGASLATALHVNTVALEKIWHRVFLAGSRLVVGDQQITLPEECSRALTVEHVISAALDPLFDALYPSHPHFVGRLGHRESATLISSFLSGSSTRGAEGLGLAEAFAVPLGLAELSGDGIVPTPAEKLLNIPTIAAALGSVDADAIIALDQLDRSMSSSPYGLTREARHLLLAALVAQKHFEFVTSSGNRINHRSLDLQIIWDDIVGLAKPLTEGYSATRLLSWAKLITGNSAIRSLDKAEDRTLISDSLVGWLTGWNQSRILSDFDSLPDECLSAAIWRTAANLRKSFGSMAEIIGSLVKKDLSLEESLQAIADVFSDSEKEFEHKKSELRILRDYTSAVRMRSEIVNYLTLCEDTGDEALERSRLTLTEAVQNGRFHEVNPGGDHFVEVWLNFKDMYSAYYVERHDTVMNSAVSGEKLREALRSESWAVFESLSIIKWLERSYFERARNIVREMRLLYCGGNAGEVLKSRPFCGCSFSLAEADRLAELPTELEATIGEALKVFTETFVANRERLAAAVDSDAMSASVAGAIDTIAAKGIAALTSQEIRVLRIAAEQVGAGEPVGPRATRPDVGEGFEEVWENEVRKVEEFVNTEI